MGDMKKAARELTDRITGATATTLGEAGAVVAIYADPCFPTFEPDYGDFSAAMAGLPPGTTHILVTPCAAPEIKAVES